MSIATDPGRRSRPPAPPVAGQRSSSPEALVATQLVAPAGLDPAEPAYDDATAPRTTKRRTRTLLLGAALLASAAGFVAMQRIQDQSWPGALAASRPATSLAKGAQVRSITPQLPPGPSASAPVHVAAPTTMPAAQREATPPAAEAAEPRVAAVRVPPMRAQRALSRRPSAVKPAKLEAHSAATAAHSAALRDEPDVGF